MGLSVPKRVGSAVCRNKVRRRLREIFRSVAPGLREGVDVVVSARPAAADASFEEMESEFRRALGRMKGIGGAENGGEGR